MTLKLVPNLQEVKQRSPWYGLFLVIVIVYLWVIYTNIDKLIDLAVATLSVLIGILLTVFIIFWQRGQDLENLIPVFKLETDANVMHLENLQVFLTNNHHSYKAVWGRVTAITNQFQDSGYQAIRDARLLNELGRMTKSAWVSYARLTQVRGIAQEGIAVQVYDAEILAHDRTNGNEQLDTLKTITDICLIEMKSLAKLLPKKNLVKHKHL